MSEKPLILVVDDSELQGLKVAKDLAATGYPSAYVNNAKEALEYLSENPSIEICIADIHMPEMNGLTFASKIRTELQRPDIKIIILSSHSKAELEEQAEGLDIFSWLVKPLNSAALAKVLDKARA
jgi:CheY-like chemotaxis protein|tara:strand:- start:56 stop:430 length:375 start_codon:yes stop_codon:yes gene_type:complete